MDCVIILTGLTTLYTMNINEILQNSTLDNLDSQLLLGYVLQQPRSFVLAHPEYVLTPAQQQQFQQLMLRRQQGEPIAYILGQQEFWSLNLTVTPEVLIPRPETELVIELLLTNFSNEQSLAILDLGTGSGAIALALADEKPTWQITATDKSTAALDIAQQNAQDLKIENIIFKHSDWFNDITQQYNVIVSNPPYIAADDVHLSALQYEPKSALIADDNGLAEYQKIIAQAKAHLQPEGLLFLEHGYQQADAIQALLQQHGFNNITTVNDLANLPRVTWANV